MPPRRTRASPFADRTRRARGIILITRKAAQGLWDDFKAELANHVECGIDRYELCAFPGLAVDSVRVGKIDAQLRPHADDIDDETGEIIRNEYV